MTADIDLDSNLLGGRVFDKAVIAPDVNDANGWFDGIPFSGVFDGDGHTILRLTVTGGSSLGLFGRVAGHWAEVRNLGMVDVYIAGSSNFVGGLAGHNYGRFASSCTSGSVSGTFSVGGLVGCRRSSRNMSSFWDTQTSGQTSSAGGEGKTTAEMQTVKTFLDAGWDFVGETANGTEDIWWILEGLDYPRLWWELND